MAKHIKTEEKDLELEELLDSFDDIDLEDLDIDIEDEEDLDSPVEVEEEEYPVDEDPEPPAKKESKPKRKPRAARKPKAKAPVEKAPQEPVAVQSDTVSGKALDLISSALELRESQIKAAPLSEGEKQAALDQVEYAKQVISLFLYG